MSDEAGEVKLLHTKLADYAADSVSDRETLILLRVESEFRQEPLKCQNIIVTGNLVSFYQSCKSFRYR